MPPDSLRGQDSFVNISGTATLLVGPSEKRWALVLFPSNGGRYTLSNKSTVTLDNGPTIITQGGPVVLKYNEAGDWIRGQIWAIATGAQAVGFVEVLGG